MVGRNTIVSGFTQAYIIAQNLPQKKTARTRFTYAYDGVMSLEYTQLFLQFLALRTAVKLRL